MFNKIKFKWAFDDLNSEPGKPKYMVQMKSRSHYGMKDGDFKQMFYRVRLLWDKNFELDAYPDRNWEAEGPSKRQPRTARPAATNVNTPSQGSSGPKKLTIKKR